MSETCKYCGGEFDDDLYEDCCSEECEERLILECRIDALQGKLTAYEAILPLPPSDWGGEITADVCERLHMNKNTKCITGTGESWDEWRLGESILWENGSDLVWHNGKPEKATAGQLMLLVAARRLQKDAR